MSIAPVRCCVEVPQDPARAFELFATRIGDWWRDKTIGPKPPVAIVIEPFAGGRWYERDADGLECDWGKVLAWEPPAKLLLGWQLDSRFKFDPNLVTEVELCFRPLPSGGTEVSLEHRQLERLGTDAPRVAALLGGGWPTLIGHYRAFTHKPTKEHGL